MFFAADVLNTCATEQHVGQEAHTLGQNLAQKEKKKVEEQAVHETLEERLALNTLRP